MAPFPDVKINIFSILKIARWIIESAWDIKNKQLHLLSKVV